MPYLELLSHILWIFSIAVWLSFVGYDKLWMFVWWKGNNTVGGWVDGWMDVLMESWQCLIASRWISFWEYICIWWRIQTIVHCNGWMNMTLKIFAMTCWPVAERNGWRSSLLSWLVRSSGECVNHECWAEKIFPCCELLSWMALNECHPFLNNISPLSKSLFVYYVSGSLCFDLHLLSLFVF